MAKVVRQKKGWLNWKEIKKSVYIFWRTNKNRIISGLSVLIYITGLIIATWLGSTRWYLLTSIPAGILTILIYSKLVDMIVVVGFDLQNSEFKEWLFSYQMFNKYDLQDYQGKESGIEWNMKALTGMVVIADDVDPINMIIKINKCCSNTHFVNRFKDKLVYLAKLTTKQRWKISELLFNREYKTVRRASEFYEKHPVIKMVYELQEKVEKEEEKLKEKEEEQEDEVLIELDEEEIQELQEELLKEVKEDELQEEKP